jgi:hypothetical protein
VIHRIPLEEIGKTAITPLKQHRSAWFGRVQ